MAERRPEPTRTPGRPRRWCIRGGDGDRPARRAAGRRAGRRRTGSPRSAPDLDGPAGPLVLDAGGCVVAPGLVDLHTHLRQPGREEAETVETGTRAASLGGFTAVVAMPNTEPALDSAEAVRNVYELAARATAEVAVAGAITVGRAGERLAPMAELAELGVRLFTDDGAGVQSAGLMRRALEYATGLGVTLAQHCEDADAGRRRGHARGGLVQPPGASRACRPLAEEVMVARDIALARATGAGSTSSTCRRRARSSWCAGPRPRGWR